MSGVNFYYCLLCLVCCSHVCLSGDEERLSKLERLVETQANRINQLEGQAKSTEILVATQNERIEYLEKITEDQDKETKHIERYTTGAEGKRIASSDTESTNVAFYAYMSNPIHTPTDHHTLVFDHVITNVGNGYNKHAGDFIAPVSGVYVFAFTIVSAYQSLTPVELVVNSVPVGVVTPYNRSYNFDSSASGTVVVSLSQGDTCFLRTQSTTLAPILGSIHSAIYERTMFAGWKL